MNKKRWIVVTALGASVAMAFAPSGPAGGFWGPEPTPGLGGGVFGALMVYAVLEAIAFGFGVAWLAFGRRITTLSTAAYLAIGWMLASWAPHGAFHQSTAHGNWAGLALIEYGFHLTMIVAASIVARELLRPVSSPEVARVA